MNRLRRVWNAARERLTGSEAGYTLAELLTVIAITSVIVVAIASSFVVAAQTTVQANTRLRESADVALLNAYFVADASGASSMSTTEVPACGAGMTPVILFDLPNGDQAFYGRPSPTSPILERLYCPSGATSPSSRVHLANNVTSAEIGCPAPADCALAGIPAHVHLTVNEQSGYAYKVQASPRTTNASVTDSGPPTVRWIRRALPNPTNRALVSWTVNFSEPVSGVNIGTNPDFYLAPAPNGSSIVQLIGSGATYTVIANTGTPTTTTIGLNLSDDNSIRDRSAAQNPLGGPSVGTNFPGEVYTVDKVRPTVTIQRATGQSQSTGVLPVRYRVDFSEDVDFGAPDLSLIGTAAGGRVEVTPDPSDSTRYDVAVYDVGDGTVIPSIEEDAVSDTAGNGNFASTGSNLTVTYESSPPRVLSIVRAGPNPTNAGSVSWTVTFSESVTGVGASDFDLVRGSGLSGGSITSVSGNGAVRTVTATTGSGSGTFGLDLDDDNSIEDPAGNDLVGASGPNGDFVGELYNLDKQPPTTTIRRASGQQSTTKTQPVNFEVEFSEAVNGFDAGDLALGGTSAGTKTAVVTGSGTTYNVAVSGASGQGTITASVTPNAAQDAAGNGNTASGTAQVSFDTPPTATITPEATPVYAMPARFTVVFSEVVTGFTEADVLVAGTAPGDKTVAVSGTGPTYTVTVDNASGFGTVIASVKPDSALDGTGNQNPASSTATVEYATLPPPAGADIQAVPSGGGNGEPGDGDQIVCTFNQVMSAASIRGSAWNGSEIDVTARFTRSSGQTTRLQIRIGGSTIPLGTVDLGDTGSRYMDSGDTVNLSARMSMATIGGRSVVTVRLTANPGRDLDSVTGATTLRWTPSSGATNPAGVASSTATVTQSGSPKQNF